jgi:hypothetical protein
VTLAGRLVVWWVVVLAFVVGEGRIDEGSGWLRLSGAWLFLGGLLLGC